MKKPLIATLLAATVASAIARRAGGRGQAGLLGHLRRRAGRADDRDVGQWDE